MIKGCKMFFASFFLFVFLLFESNMRSLGRTVSDRKLPQSPGFAQVMAPDITFITDTFKKENVILPSIPPEYILYLYQQFLN